MVRATEWENEPDPVPAERRNDRTIGKHGVKYVECGIPKWGRLERSIESENSDRESLRSAHAIPDVLKRKRSNLSAIIIAEYFPESNKENATSRACNTHKLYFRGSDTDPVHGHGTRVP